MRREHEDEELWGRALRRLIRLLDLVIAKLESEQHTSATLTIEGEPMANEQINAGDSIVATLTVTDDETGDVVSPDAGSITTSLSESTDSVVDNGDGTFTLSVGSTLSTGNTLTVNGTVNGVAFAAAVGTYDVVADVTPPDTFTGTLSFGTETAPTGVAASSVVEEVAPVTNRPNGLE